MKRVIKEKDRHWRSLIQIGSWSGRASFLFKTVLFIHLFLAVLGLRCRGLASPSDGESGPLCCGAWASHCCGSSCRRAWASVVAVPTLGHRLSSYGAGASSPLSMWDLPRPGVKPVFPALALGFLTTDPPGKPRKVFFEEDLRVEYKLTQELDNFQEGKGGWRE